MKHIRTSNLIFIILINLITTAAFAVSNDFQVHFESAEHMAAGDDVKLFFSSHDNGKAGKPLTMPNGLNLTYGEILSFGDFYEIPNAPISFGKTEEERKIRFLQAFNSFAYSADYVQEAIKILKVLHNNQRIVDEAIKRGENPEVVFKNIANESNRQFNCITGGSCAKSDWWLHPGRYLKLAETDYDHFGSNAWLAYNVGHQAALEEAIRAHQTGDLTHLKIAYAMNAFASHFLTDRFASGHMRSPRVELPTHVTPKVAGALLVHYMHGEENAHGLHVHNERGDRWIAYGDRTFFTQKNKPSREILLQAMQASVLQVFYTYLTGEIQDNQSVHNLLPYPDEMGNKANLDISPLFYWDHNTQKVMRRLDVANIYDRRWTADWWGWSTLVLLANVYGVPGQLQGQLVRSKYAAQAVQDDLIRNQTLLERNKALF